MAFAGTRPIPAVLPARPLRHTNVAAITPMVCTILAISGVGLALIPQATWRSFPRELVIWGTFVTLFVLAAGSYAAAKIAGHSPWIAPISLVGIYFFFRYGFGTLVVQYGEDYPWSAFPLFRWNFHRFGMWQHLPGGCQLIVVFAIGMTIGSLLGLASRRSLLPRFTWPFSEEKLKRRAMAYTPIAALLNVAQFVLPVSVRFIITLLGSFVYPLIMLGAYYLFSARNAKERAQWMTFLTAACALTIPTGLISGQVNALILPVVCVFLGYTIAKGSPPWKLIAFTLPLFCLVILPLSSLYKAAGAVSSDIGQRLDYATKKFSKLGHRGRFELTLERTLIRFTGSGMPAVYSAYYPTAYSFEYGKSFVIESSIFVPRVLWPAKPFAAYELNRYPAKVGLVEYEGNTTALFDAVSEYYLNFGILGMFVLAIVHGYYWQALYKWFSMRVHALVGAVLVVTCVIQNEDFYGVGLLFTSMTRTVPVWLIMFYLLSRDSRPKHARY